MCVTCVLTSQSAREGTSLANKRVSLGQEPLKKAMLDQKIIGVEPDPILGLHLVIYLFRVSYLLFLLLLLTWFAHHASLYNPELPSYGGVPPTRGWYPYQSLMKTSQVKMEAFLITDDASMYQVSWC